MALPCSHLDEDRQDGTGCLAEGLSEPSRSYSKQTPKADVTQTFR